MRPAHFEAAPVLNFLKGALRFFIPLHFFENFLSRAYVH